MSQPLVRPSIAALAAYTPGEQPGPGQRVIKLNTNENPYPPSPRVMAALAAIEPESLRRYPNPTADEFRDTAGALLDLPRSHILAGNGSDDILSIAVRTFLDPGELLAFPDPTYSLYPVLADIGQVRHVGVPWEPGLTLPVEGLLACRPKAIFLANPNAPTGHLVPLETLAALLEQYPGLVLVDEAYADFAGVTAAGLVSRHANLLVCRTFSKGYSLAGLRFGYVIAQPTLIEQMMKVKDSYNCDAISIRLATAALQDQAYARQTWEAVIQERRRLTSALEQRGWTVIPSQANFVLATPPARMPSASGEGADKRHSDARRIYEGLKQRGILVRYFDKSGLADKVRITIGTPADNDALLAALDGL
jgi:histidinol-phosphate aminotransferase